MILYIFYNIYTYILYISYYKSQYHSRDNKMMALVVLMQEKNRLMISQGR